MSVESNLGINLYALVDTSQASKTLNEFVKGKKGEQSRKVILDLDIETQKAMDALNSKVVKQVDDSMQRISTKIKTGFSGIFNGKELEGLTKVSEKFSDIFGKIQERTTIINSEGKAVTSSLKTIKEGVVNVTTSTEKALSKVGETDAIITTVTNTLTDTAGKTHIVTETTKEWIDEEGRLNTEISKTDEKGNELCATYTKMSNDAKKVAKFNKELADSLSKVNQQSVVKDTGKSTIIDKNGVKTITEYVNGVATLRTEISKQNDGLTQLTTTTKVYDAQTNKLISTNKEVSRNYQQEAKDLDELINKTFAAREAQKKLEDALVQTKTTTATRKTTQWGSGDTTEYNALVTTIRMVDKEGKITIKTIEEFTNAEGHLVKQTRTTDENLKKIAEDEQVITEQTNKTTDANKKLGQSFNETAKHTNSLSESLSNAVARLAKYYVASIPIRLFREAIQEAVTAVKEFDNALVEFRKVSDLAGESLTKYVAKLAEMGKLTGSTMTAMVEASTEFKKSGFSEEDSAKLASIAEMYRNIADEEISASDSASFIIAQMKAFNIEADKTEHIIDAVNEVANNFAVSSADIATNLGKMSATMAVSGVTFEQQIGMLTGVTEITRNASAASRGLVMISSRLTQVLDDTSSTGKKLTKIYKNLGIELKDNDGQLRSTYDILSDLAEQWDNLSENEQKYIALTSSGARQQQNFVALMKNFNTVVDATTTAETSAGSAMKENGKVMDSVAKKTEVLKSEFQKLVIGKGGLQDLAKQFLTIGTALLKFANTDVAKAIAVLIALESTLVLVRKAWIALQAASSTNILASAITSLIAGEVTLGQVTKALTAKFIENAIAWASTPMGMISIAVAAIAAAVYATYELSKALEDATEKTIEFANASKQTQNEVDNLKTELDNIAEKLQKIKEQRIQLTDANELENLNKRTKELERQEGSLKRQLALQMALLEEQHKEETEAAKEALKTTTTSKYKTGERVRVTASGRAHSGRKHAHLQVTPTEELKLATEEYKKLESQIKSTNEALKQEEQLNGIESEKYLELAKSVGELEAQKEEAIQRGTEMAEIVQTNTDSLYGQDTATKQLKETNYGLLDEFYKTIGIYDEVEDKINDTTKTEEELEEESEQLEQALDSFAKTTGLSIEDAYSVLQDFADRTGLTLEESVEKIQDFAKELGISERVLIENANALGFTIEEYYKFASALQQTREVISNTSQEIDNLQDALNNAQTALEEYNDKGYLTLDTFQSLMGVSAQYLAALINEEGQLEINQTTLGNLVEQLKIAKVQELAQAAAMEIAANHTQGAATASSNAVQPVASIGNTIADVGNKAATAAGQVASFGTTVAKLSGISYSAMTAEDKKILNYYKDIAKELANIEVNTTKAGNAGASAGKKGAGGAKQAKDATKELNSELEKTKSNYDKVITFITGRIDKRIKAIQKEKESALDAIEAEIKAKEKQKDKALDAIEAQIKALEKEKKAREKYWDEQIDALKKANDERKDALELQEKLDALERAKNTKVKVYKEGQGFVYDVDQTAVAEAQQALDEYLSEKAYEEELERLNALKDAESENFSKRIDALNEYKDKVEASYEKQIEALQAHKEALEKEYDAQIEYYENFKEQFEEMVKAYEDKQTELLATQLTGINFENDNWMTRLDNLAKFVNEYNRLQGQLENGSTDNANTAQLSGGGGLPKGNTTKTTVTNQDTPNKQYSPTYNTKTPQQREYEARVKHIKTHASGVSSIDNDEIAVVGENPNKEIVVGSKLNNGQLMSLNKGDGVVNASSSNTLAGMLNQLGKFGSSGFGSGNGTLNSNINNDSLVINGVTVQGANIKDPQTFVNGLLNLKAEALQRAYKHR